MYQELRVPPLAVQVSGVSKKWGWLQSLYVLTPESACGGTPETLTKTIHCN